MDNILANVHPFATPPPPPPYTHTNTYTHIHTRSINNTIVKSTALIVYSYIRSNWSKRDILVSPCLSVCVAVRGRYNHVFVVMTYDTHCNGQHVPIRNPIASNIKCWGKVQTVMCTGGIARHPSHIVQPNNLFHINLPIYCVYVSLIRFKK